MTKLTMKPVVVVMTQYVVKASFKNESFLIVRFVIVKLLIAYLEIMKEWPVTYFKNYSCTVVVLSSGYTQK